MLWSLAVRCVGLTLLIAIVSCWVQLDAFGGSRGLQPIAVKLAKMRLHHPRPWLSTPSLLWLASSDAALHGWAALGTAAALRTILGGSGSCAALLLANVVYLSFDPVFGLSMPWDCLLLEAAWCASLLPCPAALTSTTSLPSFVALLTDPEPVHPAAAFLVRWLLFRLLLGFGKLKFKGAGAEDALYVRDFMILQPMPSRLGYLAHRHMPHALFRLLLRAMFFTEIIAPWLLLLPLVEVPCRLAALLFIGLMGGIMAHGSFGHFNLLTASLSMPLLPAGGCPSLFSAPLDAWCSLHGVSCALALAFLVPMGLLHLPFSSGLSRSFASFPQLDKWVSPRKRLLMSLVRALQPYRLVHSYGVFPPHTAPGLKIVPVVEGSNDGGRTWRRYRYRYMPSASDSPPRWCAPHQPRLDYRMFYEGIGSTPDNMLAGTLALHEPYALSRAGFCDRLLQRLLEGDGPVASLFGHNPFEGGKPTLVRMITIALEPLPSDPSSWWTERVWGVHRPPTAAKPEAVWPYFVDEPEVLHWDGLFHRRACQAHLGAETCRGGLAPSRIELHRPALKYDGHTLVSTSLSVSASDIDRFWADFIGMFSTAERADWRGISTHARRLHGHYEAHDLWRFELVLNRLTAQLAAKLAPLLWAPGWPLPTALAPPTGQPSVESWFGLMLICQHIIGQGRAAFEAAMEDPIAAVAPVARGGIWPDRLLEAGAEACGAWCAVSEASRELAEMANPAAAEPAAAPNGSAGKPLGGGGGASRPVRSFERIGGRSAQRGSNGNGAGVKSGGSEAAVPMVGLRVQSAAFLYVLLRWPTFSWHATKWRLCKQACSPWQLATPRRGAGVLELVDLIAACVVGGGASVEADGEVAESYPLLRQGADLLWREGDRRLGIDPLATK